MVPELRSLSKPKQVEFLALKLQLLKAVKLDLIGCYRPPSATVESLDSLAELTRGKLAWS